MMIILKLEDKTIELNTHDVEGETLYKAQDLLTGYGLTVEQSKQKLKYWTNTKCKKFTPLKVKGSKGGTYLDERHIIKLAGFIDDEFEDSVYEAFKELVNGNHEKALDVALSVAVPVGLINKEKALREEMNDLIKEKLGGGHNYSNYSKLACKAVSGYIPSELTGKTDSAFSYIVTQKHVEGAGAYIATLEMIVISLKAGLSYHQVAAMLQVKTGKNKDMMLVA